MSPKHAEYTPISLLPPEILAKIQVLAIRGDYFATSQYLPYDETGCVPSWSEHVTLTMVCTTWRKVALDHAEYWTSIPFFRLAQCTQFPQMFSRSKAAPFSLKLDYLCQLEPTSERALSTRYICSAATDPLLLVTLLDPSRLQDLHLFGDGNLQTQILKQFPRASTPLLQSIIVCSPANDITHPLPFIAELPAHILAFPRPALRLLSLRLCHVSSLQLELCPNLVDIRLEYAEHVSVHDLLNSLAFVPKLEHLRIYSSLIDANNRDLPEPPRANLMSVRKLDIMDDVIAFTKLYAGIIHPQSTELEFTCDFPSGQPENIYAPLFHLCGISTSNSTRPFHRITIHTSSTGDFALTLELDPTSNHPVDSPKAGRLQFSGWTNDSQWLDDLQVTGAQELDLRIEDPVGDLRPLPWDRFLERQSEVRSLHLTKHDCEDFLNTIGVAAESRASGILLPHLRHLYLRGLYFIIEEAVDNVPSALKALIHYRTGRTALLTIELVKSRRFDGHMLASLAAYAAEQNSLTKVILREDDWDPEK